MRKQAKSIVPKSVTDLLYKYWKKTPGKTAKLIEANPGRVDNPNHYLFMKDNEPFDPGGINSKETFALFNAGVFTDTEDKPDDGNTYVAINEHYKHSLEEFLGEMSEVMVVKWKEHLARCDEYVKPTENI